MRIFLVSNRVAMPRPGHEIRAGGLEVALRGVLQSHRCVWVGWSGDAVEDGHEISVSRTRVDNVDYVVTDLHRRDFEEYYNGFANRVLWPVLHYRQDLAEFSRRDLTGYLRVNDRFADLLAPLLKPDDIVWVHDYHLMPLARILRQRGLSNRIGFFLHIPMPPPEVVVAMPGHKRVIGALKDYDLVGFQTEADTANFARYVAMQIGTTPHIAIAMTDGHLRLGTFPVGIETRAFRGAAATAAESEVVSALRRASPNIAIGVDRLDYSKGLDLKLEAYGRFLKANPEWSGKVTFLQITPKTRSSIAEYASMATELATRSGRLNSEFGDALWTPVRYVTKAYPREILAGFFRASRVGVVTPLRDGMNLVAKEYVAAQDEEDPGVLVLSEFAGAAAELVDALIVNPNDPEAVASAIARALTMPLDERKDRQQRLWKALEATDISKWGARFIGALQAQPHTPDTIHHPVAAE